MKKIIAVEKNRMKQSSLFFSFPVCQKIYSRLLKSRQRSSLNPFQSPMNPFDCHRHGIFLQKILLKAFNFYFQRENTKNQHFLGFRPQYFFYRLCPNWLIFSTWGFLATVNTNLKEFFYLDHIQVPFRMDTHFCVIKALSRPF